MLVTLRERCYLFCFTVEILSGGESEGGSVEDTVCQETQEAPDPNFSGNVDKATASGLFF